MQQRRPVLDSTLALLTEGYAWLPERLRRAGAPAVHTRLFGRRVLAMRGPEAVRFFYDERHVRRHGAVPEPVRGTLFGDGAVHTLDGADHRDRKRMFLSLLHDPDRVTALANRTVAAWDDAVAAWAGRDRVVLFDEAGRVITEAACDWAGVPLAAPEVGPVATDLVAMVDGFATLGPRHWRARRARGRQEDRLAALVRDVRDGTIRVPAGSVVAAVAGHRDGGALLDARLAAVELLNIVRPTVAICWFVAFAAHAMHRWPEQRARLRAERAVDGYPLAFAHEVRRFYPFAPFVGGRAATDLTWRGERVPAGSLVLLDVYGQNHDPTLWLDPYRFDPRRFLGRPPGRDELIPQGGGDPHTNHRCPGEDVAVTLLAVLSSRLAALDYDVAPQDLTISLRRIPALPRSRFVIGGVRPPGG